MGTQLPHPKKRRSAPQFSARVYCGQTAGCIRIPLDWQVGLGPDNIVLDGDRALRPRKGAQFVYAVFAIFLLPVWAYALVLRRLLPFLQCLRLAPDIASLDRYRVV